MLVANFEFRSMRRARELETSKLAESKKTAPTKDSKMSEKSLTCLLFISSRSNLMESFSVDILKKDPSDYRSCFSSSSVAQS